MEIPELLLLISFVACIFGIFYLFFMTRHRERMALINKGENADVFYPAEKTISQINRFIVLNISLTFIGIGAGIIIAMFLYQALNIPAVFPACIFLFAGIGLLASFFINRLLDQSQN